MIAQHLIARIAYHLEDPVLHHAEKLWRIDAFSSNLADRQARSWHRDPRQQFQLEIPVPLDRVRFEFFALDHVLGHAGAHRCALFPRVLCHASSHITVAYPIDVHAQLVGDLPDDVHQHLAERRLDRQTCHAVLGEPDREPFLQLTAPR